MNGRITEDERRMVGQKDSGSALKTGKEALIIGATLGLIGVRPL
jgi:hypothetical protein